MCVKYLFKAHMIEFNKFRNKTIRQIRIWAWLAAVLPMSALAATFFIWTFGTETMVRNAMIVGETTMFTIAVIWWWWAIFVIRRLVDYWTLTDSNIVQVLDEIKEIKEIAIDINIDVTDK